MYNYQTERQKLFTEQGQVMFLKIRDRVNDFIAKAGAVRSDAATATVCGESWLQLACLDRLVELKEIVEVTGSDSMGQYRIFTKYRE